MLAQNTLAVVALFSMGLVGCTSKPVKPSEAMVNYQLESRQVDLNSEELLEQSFDPSGDERTRPNDTYENQFGTFQKKGDPTFGYTIQTLKDSKENSKKSAEIIWY